MILSTNKNLAALARTALSMLVLLFALVACSSASGGAPPQPATTIRIVTTTNIVADWAANVGGDHVEVFSLVPVGADPHSFQPGAQDIAKIADADLVLSVGLGLEESWLNDLLQNAARDPSTIVEFGEMVDPIEFAESHIEEVDVIEGLSHIVHEVEEGEIGPEVGLAEIKVLLEGLVGEEGVGGEAHEDEDELPAMALAIVGEVETGNMAPGAAMEAIEELAEEGEEEHDDHGHGIHDPHFWFDPVRVKIVVNEIAALLSGIDPERGSAYDANASAYNLQIDELHQWSEQQLSQIPEDRKLLATSHDSLGYFANRYGFEVVGVILSITTEVEPSAEDLADLVDKVRDNEVPAVFGETTVSERLAAAVARESGAKLVRLYSGSLGTQGSGAETFVEMTRTNVERIAEGLK